MEHDDMYKKLAKQKLQLLVLISTAMVHSLVSAEMSQDEKSDASEYINNCAVCHGINGKGDGPMHGQLTKQPKDLTVLSLENGGSFPETVVYQIIDGRRINLSHGSGEMPVWGKRFRIIDGNEDAVDARIARIIKHIESLQK